MFIVICKQVLGGLDIFLILRYSQLGDFMEKTTIYLIRHSEQIKDNKIWRSTELEQIRNEKVILSVIGERKAKELSENVEFENIEFVFSSNYVRAIATAKYIADKNNIEINIDERLGERKLRKFRNS